MREKMRGRTKLRTRALIILADTPRTPGWGGEGPPMVFRCGCFAHPKLGKK